jgi:hypothetical protein
MQEMDQIHKAVKKTIVAHRCQTIRSTHRAQASKATRAQIKHKIKIGNRLPEEKAVLYKTHIDKAITRDRQTRHSIALPRLRELPKEVRDQGLDHQDRT